MTKPKMTWGKLKPALKPPVADHLVCMACGAHVEHGMMKRHYKALGHVGSWRDDSE